MTLDAVDYSILDTLQQEGRITNAELATRVGLTPAPTLARVNKLEQGGYIRGYVALLNRDILGLPMTAFVAVILRSHGLEASHNFLKAVEGLPEVLECHHIAGDEDYLLKVAVASPADYEHFVLSRLSAVADVQRVKTTIVLSTPIYKTSVPIHQKGYLQ